ncbi:hypothetical protein [Paraburkholderia silvatlantica]|uniref:hypothetical protein n=1 Tax=Paraburkholderia silvatlantica TaxID=321895 RepID=UPI0011B7D869|nr:hypothetical protein [Paraburkholderia silvatlantica]
MKYVVVLKAVAERTLHQMSINQSHLNARMSAGGVPMLRRGSKPRTFAEQLDVSAQREYNCTHPRHESSVCGPMVADIDDRRPPLSEARTQRPWRSSGPRRSPIGLIFKSTFREHLSEYS